MPVTVTVSQVRAALYSGANAADSAGEGAASHPLLGTWFHEALQWLVSGDGAESRLSVLATVAAERDVWAQTLIEQVYDRFVGPRLTSQRAALHPYAGQVAAFWQAMEAGCQWLADLCWTLHESSAGRRSPPVPPWRSLAESFSIEEPLECRLHRPDWNDSVRLVGTADAVVRLTQTQAWCAVEFKLGRSAPTVDLGQACLYHLLLTTAARSSAVGESAPGGGALAVVSFQPQRVETVFAAEQLTAAQEALVALIGRIAKVCGPHIPPGPTPPPKPTEEHLRMGEAVVQALAEYKVAVSIDGPPVVGPTFLRFPIALGRGVKVSAVERRAAELQIRLNLREEPFIQRDQGRLVVDVQRPDRQTIDFHSVISQLPPQNPLVGGSAVPVGVDLEGTLVAADLARTEHAHFLVAGTTGSGKSEWLRLAVAGLIRSNSPQTLRLLVIDPKRNAFHSLRESPFLWRPLAFPDEQPASRLLEELVEEMDARYRILDGADSIAQLVQRTGVSVPRIVCICDEYRDLISRNRAERKRIEAAICRLGAKSRAAGIHLILATQEASRDTIKGALDANIPARVGLKMGKSLESNMLLGESGAEKLLGHGDLLFKDVGAPRRLQAPLLTEVDRLKIFGGGA